MKGFFRAVGGFRHLLKAHVQGMARLFIHMHGNHIPLLAGSFPLTFFMFVIPRACFPFLVLVAFLLMAARADGAIRMLVFLMGVAFGAGFPFLVLVFLMAVVGRAGSAVLVLVFSGGLLFSACGIEAKNGSEAQDDGKIETFHIR